MHLKYRFRTGLGVFALMSMASFTVACDDTGDGTSSTGTPGFVCGDGTQDAGEACDDGNKDNGDGCSATCQVETAGECGDGTTNIGEECDDGNLTSGDGCSMTCLLESAPVCGNGKKEGTEQCDDGNTMSGDGCSATCTSEGMGTCGDGVTDAGEQCDDGNQIALDGCENDCTVSPTEVMCGTITPTANLCEVTPGSAAKVISGDVLAPATIYRGGSVALDAMGKITCVGCDCAAQNPGATQIVCAEAVISPGLVNTHEHITFAQNQPYNDTGERYEQRHDWRKGFNGHTKIPSMGSASQDQVRWGELRFLLSGATSLVGSGSATGFLRNLDTTNQEGLGIEAVDFDTFPLGDGSAGTQLATGCGYPAINTSAAIAGDSAYLPHIAEGIDAFANNEFNCVDDDRMTHDLVQPNSAFIHAVGLTPADYAEMAGGGTSLIWSPRSNITLYGNTAQVTIAARLGVNIALGTDWVITGSMNMQRELTCASELNANYYNHFFSDGDLFRMVTINAAKALHAENDIGSLAQGLIGDIAIYDARVHTDYRAIIDGEPKDVALVLRGGKPIYGDDAVISTIPNSGACDALDVCGNAKRLCTTSEVGKTFTALETSAGNVYDAFFCGKPTNEPSCVPTRPAAKNNSTIYTGTITAGDSDGDGIPNGMDNCPNVFNPIRPMDNGVQPNVDGDADGDACDPCPLNPNTTSCMTTAGDADGDGVPNSTDNCPNQANMDQADGDTDGKGDVCDACPTYANPGSAACITTIYKIKNGMTPLGPVALANQLVTGCVPTKGYFLQVKPGDADYDAAEGANHSGIFVFDAATNCMALKVGDRIDISTATSANFFGQIQLSNAMATVKASMNEALPAPTVVTPAMAGGATANALEAVLVKVNNVSVTDIAPAAGPGDMAPTNEFVVDGALRVNDFIFLVTPFPSVGTAYTSITGILDYKNNNMKLEPRSAADYQSGPAMFVGFNEASTFTRAGYTSLPTFTVPLEVVMTSAVASNTFVSITSGNGAVTIPGGGTTIPAGQSKATVLVNGVSQAASVTLTATLGATMDTATVRVLGANEQPVVTSITPSTATIPVGGMQAFDVQLDIPAPPGLMVALTQSPMMAGTLTPSSLPFMTDSDVATFTYTDGSTASSATVTATLGASMATANLTMSMVTGSGLVINEVDYDNVGTGDSVEFVELYNAGASTVSLAGVALILENGSSVPGTEYDRYDLTALGSLAPGEYLILGPPVLTSSLPSGVKFINYDSTCGTNSNCIQNGAPDAVGLVNLTTGSMIDSLAYEGAMTGAVNGVGVLDFSEPPMGPSPTAVDSNTANGSMCRSPNGTDTNNAAMDWKFCMTPTPGAANN